MPSGKRVKPCLVEKGFEVTFVYSLQKDVNKRGNIKSLVVRWW